MVIWSILIIINNSEESLRELYTYTRYKERECFNAFFKDPLGLHLKYISELNIIFLHFIGV